MAVPSSLSAGQGFLEALKKTYTADKLRAKFELNHPFMKMIKKEAISEGQNHTYAIGLTYGSGFGNNLATVLAGTAAGNPSSGAKMANITVNTGDDYAVIELDRKFLARSKKADAAFADQLKYQVDRQLEGLGNVVAKKLRGTGYGQLTTGVLTSVGGALTAGAYTTFYVPPSATKYLTEGMRLAFGDAGVIDVHASNLTTVTSFNDETGVVICTSFTIDATATECGLAGIYGQTTNASGLEAWIPLTAPGAVATVGPLINTSVNRNLHLMRLSGHRYSSTSRPIDESVFILAERMQERGYRPDVCLVSYNTFNKIASKQWNKIVPNNIPDAEKLGLQRLGIQTAEGVIPFVCDSSMKDDRGYLLTKDTWRMVHLSDAVPARITDAAGNDNLFEGTGDAVQIRYYAWWNLKCIEPAANGVFAVDSTQF
jgi:hypothetical protein